VGAGVGAGVGKRRVGAGGCACMGAGGCVLKLICLI
jgi:hypothetical protein